MKAFRWLLPYLMCTAVIVSLYFSIAHWLPGRAWFAFYYCLSFWSLIGTEAYLTWVRKRPPQANWATEDRFLSYLVTAPFIWPVQIFKLVKAASDATQSK